MADVGADAAPATEPGLAHLHAQLAAHQQAWGHVSHELRTPLATIRMAADVLYGERELLTDSGRRAAELLVSQVERFQHLLDDLLELSRLDAGTAEFVTERVDLTPLVARLVIDFRALADGVHVSMSGPQSLVVCADRRRVERIIRNLLANALTHGGGRPVHIMISRCTPGQNPDSLGVGPGSNPTSLCPGVLVEVADSGEGLPANAVQVFERFWRGDPSRARPSTGGVTGGVGLGLSLAAEDALLHGGLLRARSSPEGATFALWLPVGSAASSTT